MLSGCSGRSQVAGHCSSFHEDLCQGRLRHAGPVPASTAPVARKLLFLLRGGSLNMSGGTVGRTRVAPLLLWPLGGWHFQMRAMRGSKLRRGDGLQVRRDPLSLQVDERLAAASGRRSARVDVSALAERSDRPVTIPTVPWRGHVIGCATEPARLDCARL